MRRLMGALFLQANLVSVLGIIAAYIVVSYVLMFIAGEADLLRPSYFLYWLMVTGSTVGYGDFSPATALGRAFTALWVIPAGLSVFALIIAKISFYLSELILKGKRGLRMSQLTQHTVIIGWNGQRTLRLIELLQAKGNASKHPIVLCVTADMENPLPGKIDFVKAESFSHEQTMRRVNLMEAYNIIIDTPQDDVTLTTALYCYSVNPNVHTTAYFQEESVGRLLQEHCPKVECIPAVGVEMLAKSTVDPGSSLLHKQLLDSTEGMTQYSMIYQGEETTVEPLFGHFKQQLEATLIGIRSASDTLININPSLSQSVQQGDTLYYIAKKRLKLTENIVKG